MPSNHRQQPETAFIRLNVSEDHMIYGDGPDVTTDSFELLNVIGKGAFGKVLRCRKKDTGVTYALRVIRSKPETLNIIIHPFHVKVHWVFRSSASTKIYVVMDDVRGPSAADLLQNGPVSVENVKWIAAELVAALKHLHDHDFVYRDLELNDVLIDADGTVKLADCVVREELNPAQHTVIGRQSSHAPEVRAGRTPGPPADWWSLGCVIFQLLTNSWPFPQVASPKQQTPAVATFPAEIDTDARDFIENLLTADPIDRLHDGTIQGHSWFDSVDWDALMAKRARPPQAPVAPGSSTGSGDPANATLSGFHTQGAGDDDAVDSRFVGFTFQPEG